MRKINKRQLRTLRDLIHSHMVVMLKDKEEAKGILTVIQTFGVNTMPEAVALYRYNSLRLNKGVHAYGLHRKS